MSTYCLLFQHYSLLLFFPTCLSVPFFSGNTFSASEMLFQERIAKDLEEMEIGIAFYLYTSQI